MKNTSTEERELHTAQNIINAGTASRQTWSKCVNGSKNIRKRGIY